MTASTVTADLSRRREWAPLALIAGAGLVLAGLVALDTGGRGVTLFALGGALGAVFLGFQYGFASAWRRFLTSGESMGLAAHFLLIGLVALVILPAGMLGLTASGSVAPVSLSLVAGAFLFGIGMQLANGCGSGVLFSFGGEGPISVDRLSRHHPLEQAFLEAVGQAGYGAPHDYNGETQDGGTAFDVNIANGERSATAALIGRIRHRSNLHIRTGAHVTKLLIEGGRATGVCFRAEGSQHEAHADSEIIMSAGAVQSPQLLMLSGVGPADQLRQHGISVAADLPGVGENLHDHLEVHIKHRCASGLSQNGLLKAHRMLAIGMQWFLMRSGPAATTPSRVGAFLRTTADAAYPDIQYHFWPYFLDGWSPPPDKDGYCFDVGPVQTASRGWVRLASADPMAAPLMRLNGLREEADRRVFRDSVRITRDIAAQSAFDAFRGPEVAPGPDVTSDADIDAFVRANANSAYHVCGTCKMGQDEMAVVDPQLRVRGIDGLRVIDASIMPAITNGNTNAPSLMIGEKGAAMILAARNDRKDKTAA